MTSFLKSKTILADMNDVLGSSYIDWNIFEGKTIYITGTTGTIGSFLVATLLYAQKMKNLKLKIVANARNEKLVKEMFSEFLQDDIYDLQFHIADINNKLKYAKNVDYIIHTASPTSSRFFVEKPVEAFNTSVKGTENVLNFAKEKNVQGMIFLSSMEVYGDITDPTKILTENDLGGLDLSNPRSSYPIGKRAAEALCYSYANEYSLPVKVVRLAQVIGANVSYDDARVYAQFARSVVEKKDIVLNTTAQTIRSYCYMSDVVTGLLTVLQKGQAGEVYNLANETSAIKIKDMAQMLCDKYPNTNLKIELTNPNMYYKETYWSLDVSKLKDLGWAAKVSLEAAYDRLITSFVGQLENKMVQNLSLKNNKSNVKRLTFLQKIFSLTNWENYKQLYILGLKFKFKKRNFFAFYQNLPIQQNKIVFSNFNGSGYGCNPKYIAEEILKRKPDCDLVWLYSKPSEEALKSFPKGVRLVKYRSKQAAKEMCTAKILINNVRFCQYINSGWVKKEGQTYIQTWHGSLGIKKIDAAVKGEDFINRQWWIDAHTDSDYIDMLLSNSSFENRVFENDMWYDGKIMQVGHPRNDIFFVSDEQKTNIRNKVFENLNIQTNKKIALYVPSFRDDMRLHCYTGMNLAELKNTLEKKFGGEWCIVVRMHPRLQKYSKQLFDINNENVVDGSYYPDIQELLVSSDIAITDYSSCIFDFMLSEKPGFIFATDIEDFNTDRGFYYPLESTPFPVATNNQELLENIKNFDIEKYKSDVGAFLKEKGCMEDGHASERAVDLIFQIIGR